MTQFESGWNDPDAGTSPTYHQASQLLELGLAGERRPIDELIRRLRQPDGRERLVEAAHKRIPPDGVQPVITGLLTCKQLISLKEQAKTWLAEAATQDDATVALAIYCICIAGAAVHYRRLISSQMPEQWQLFLTDLAEVAPESWTELLLDAAVVLDEMRDAEDDASSDADD